MTEFDDTVLRDRLTMATALVEVEPARAFDALARVAPSENPADVLASMPEWPVYRYADASPARRADVFRWLLHNAHRLKRLDQRHSWSEQWLLGLSNDGLLSDAEAHDYVGAAPGRPYSPLQVVLLRRLFAQLGSDEPAIVLAKLLEAAHQHDELLRFVGDVRSELRSDAAHRRVAESVARSLQRAGGEQNQQQALSILLGVRSERGTDDELESQLAAAIEAALPDEVRDGRERWGNVLKSSLAGLGRAGKRLGKLFGGRDAELPYDKNAMSAAPRMVDPAVVERWLGRNVAANAAFEHRSFFGDESQGAVSAAAISLPALWSLAQVDGEVLDAMTFSSAGSEEGFWALRRLASTGFGTDGAIQRLKGYVAEQKVALDLQRDGFDVEFPDDASQPGFDLLVDGHEVQVKCVSNAREVWDHLERYPDIPVIVNADLADQVGGHPMVWVDPGLLNDDVLDATEETLGLLEDFADADDLLAVPVVSVGFALYRHFGDLETGRIDNEAYAKRVGVDVAARATAGAGGSIVGAAIGSLLGPVGTAVGAGLGGYIATVAGGTGAEAVNRGELCDARDAALAALREFAAWFLDACLEPRAAKAARRLAQLEGWLGKNVVEGAVAADAAAFFVASAETSARTKALGEYLRTRLAGDDYSIAHAGWVALRESAMFFHPEMRVRRAQVSEALEHYKEAS